MKAHSIFQSCVFLLFVSLTAPALADKPRCFSTYGGYCQYTGYVKQIYVNASNDILVYFDTPFSSLDEANVAGFTISRANAGIIDIDEKPEFAKLFYSTALSAQATKRKINIQMRNTLHGYLKIDRIWLAE